MNKYTKRAESLLKMCSRDSESHKSRKDLNDFIRELDEAYWKYSESLVPDTTYDKIVELRDFHSSTIGETDSKQITYKNDLVTVKHEIPMLSVKKKFTLSELSSFWGADMAEEIVMASLKYDGVAFEANYIDGECEVVSTRGDGEFGQNVTDVALGILPVEIRDESGKGLTRIIRGEFFIRKSEFESKNKFGFKNPRNTVSSILIHNKDNMASEFCIDYVVYWTDKMTEVDYSDELDYLYSLGVKTISGFTLKWKDISKMSFTDEVFNGEDIPHDGYMVTVESFKTRNKLGYDNDDVLYSVAYKPDSENSLTVFRSVVVDISRLGKITYTAVVDPVILNGTEVTHAYLHSIPNIEGLDIMIGDTVCITKGGEIIPDILSVVDRPENRQEFLLEQCPVCGEELIYRDSFQYCENTDCSARISNKIKHFFSKNCVDVDGISGRTADDLVSATGINHPLDLYTYFGADNDLSIIVDMIGQSRATKLLEGMYKSIPLSRFIAGLSIPGIGTTISELLAKHFKSLNGFMSGEASSLYGYDGIGEKVVGELMWFREYYKETVESAVANGLDVEDYHTFDGGFSGATVVITGTLSKYTRLVAEDLIRKAGGSIGDSVTKKTTHLIVGESPGSKVEKAKKYGTKILSEEEMYRILEVNNV